MWKAATRFTLRDRDGGSAAEFAVVVLVFVGVIFAVIDFGRAMWEWNMAEKATQMGVRLATVIDFVPANLQTFDATDPAGANVSAGNPIPIVAITPNPIVCDNAQCSGGWGHDSAAFDAIFTRMSGLYPGITPSNVTIEYAHIGMGIAGNPLGPDIQPLITVRISGLNFSFQTPLLGGLTIAMPDFRASLTGEDNQL